MQETAKAVFKEAMEIGRGLRRYLKHRPRLEAYMRTELHLVFEQVSNLESCHQLSSIIRAGYNYTGIGIADRRFRLNPETLDV